MSGALTDTSILAGASGAGDYTIDQSLRFNAGDAPSLYRDITSTTTSSNFTFSCWFKSTGDNSGPDASTQDCYRMMYSSGNTDVNTQIGLASRSGVTDTPDLCIRFGDIERPSGTMYFKGLSNNLIRDFSAWYHLVLSYDQSLSAASRVRLYLNGELLTLYSQTDPTSNRRWVYDKIYVGRGMGNASGNPERPWDGYMAEVHMLDGITKVASDFGETDVLTNQWKPIKYSGSYGTDGFYLKFDGGMDGFTKLLLHCDGANDGTTFTDSSPLGKTVTVNGDAHTDTGTKKFGTAALQLDGTGDSLQLADSSDWDFDSQNFTVEMWIYTDALRSDAIYQQYAADSNKVQLYLTNTGKVTWMARGGGTTVAHADSPAATISVDTWHHIAWVRNGSSMALYVDGVSQTMNVYTAYTGQDMPDIADPLYIGGKGSEYSAFTGFIDEVRVSKGVARYTSNFTVATEPFPSSSSLGTDSSGNNNDFTPDNIGITDVLVDTPTNNFATLNPLLKWYGTQTYSEGNLKSNNTSGYNANVSTIGASSGKWYFEWRAGNGSQSIGVIGNKTVGWWGGQAQYPQDASGVFVYYGGNGKLNIDGSYSTQLTTFTNDDIIGTALNLDDSEITFYKNGVVQNSGTPSALSGNITNSTIFNFGTVTYVASVAYSGWANFGQDSSFAGTETAQGNQDENDIGDFYYTPPAGYLALCSSNLGDPSIALPTEHFGTLLWTGNDAITARTLTGDIPDSADFVWIKDRSSGYDHNLYDSVRGFGLTGGGLSRSLVSNATYAEGNDGGGAVTYKWGFVSDTGTGSIEITGTSGETPIWTNKNSDNYVAWNWKAGGASTVTNNDGSIESEVSANTTAGFSIFTYTGTGAAGTVGHGLSSKPDMIIYKGRNTTSSWPVYYEQPSGAAVLGFPLLESDGIKIDSPFTWNSTVFTFTSASGYSNTSGTNYIAYAFNSVEGYSKVGTYTGNGNDDGTFVYLGFRPAFTLVKRVDVTENWWLEDNKRNTYNPQSKLLYADLGNAEATEINKDYVSNGMKMRLNNANWNASGGTYLYLAMAKNPFKYSPAR